MDAGHIAAYTITGFLGSIDTLLIIFGAILLMNMLNEAGAMRRIEAMFNGITEDARIQIVIVGFVRGQQISDSTKKDISRIISDAIEPENLLPLYIVPFS